MPVKHANLKDVQKMRHVVTVHAREREVIAPGARASINARGSTPHHSLISWFPLPQNYHYLSRSFQVSKYAKMNSFDLIPFSPLLSVCFPVCLSFLCCLLPAL